MNNLMILKDLLKDKQLTMAVYGQILIDLKNSPSIRKLLQSILQQEFLQTEEIVELSRTYSNAKTKPIT